MKLSRITIDNFKNLNNFTVDFDQNSLTAVILGRNGTGKSNLLEALIIIFRDLDLYKTPTFKYRLDYHCRGYRIHIDANPERPKREQVLITVGNEGKFGDEPISYQKFAQQSERRYLPSYVFGYYSGPSNRMEMHFEEHQTRFYKDLLRGADKPLRPLLYARHVHSQFALLSFFNEHDEHILHFLREHLGIEGMISALFVMRQPPWNSKSGDARFWNARGVVSNFLDRLYQLAFMPIRMKQRISLDFRSLSELEHLYLYLPDEETLRALADFYKHPQDFFKALESTYISKILSEVRIRLKVRNTDNSLTFRDLSEGEQQLLMVLGLLRFTKEDEALFLLDEPDTHLNPVWSIQYLEFLDEIVGTQKTSHIIMSTHNPLVIASLERPQVKIMQRDEETGKVTAEMPEDSPRGMGVEGILTSDIFGLRSALDPVTQELIDRRRELAVKDTLTEEEQYQLGELSDQLEGLDFSINARDKLYTRFVKEMTRRSAPEKRRLVALTPKQQQEQKDLIREILEELAREEEENDEEYEIH